MATPPNSQSSTKVIRIQEDEKVLLFQLREIYGNDYKKYGEYIRRESNVPLTIKKIYKLLDERKAYRRISDYFHRERAAKRIKDPRSNGADALYVRSSTRGLTQVPEQISLPNLDHEMDDDGGDDDDDIEGLNNNVEENHTGMDNDQQQPSSPTMTNGSDEHHEINHIMTDDDDQTQQIRHPSIVAAANHTRKRPVLFTNHKRSISSSTINNSTGDLFSVRAHLQKALHELDRALISRDNHHIDNDDQHRSNLTKTHLLTNGHRHSKLDDIVRTLSTVVNQQQENTRLIIDESSVLLVDDEQKQ
ncbi:unnamed protein product, partial [Adineta ricciae]